MGAIRKKHQHRNFQASPRCVDDRDRAISPLRPADHLKGGAMERVESIENLDGRVFYAQGIVSVDAFTRMYIAWCPPVGCRSITPTGFPHPSSSFFLARCYVRFFAESLSTLSSKPSVTASSVSTETSHSSLSRKSLPPGSDPCTGKNGSST